MILGTHIYECFMYHQSEDSRHGPMSPEWLANSQYIVQSLLTHVYVWCLFLDSQVTTYHSNKGVRTICVFDLRHVYLKRRSKGAT